MARTLPSIRKSVQEICEIEGEALRARSRGERFGDFVVGRSGRMGFILFHAVWFFVWILLNSVGRGKGLQFDPFP